MSTALESDLPDLARKINAAHTACASAARQSIGHALEAGRLLLEAKARVPHGSWLPWLKENCAVSERTAQVYMQIASRAGELESKAQSSADLSVSQALALLADVGMNSDELMTEMVDLAAPDLDPRTRTRLLKKAHRENLTAQQIGDVAECVHLMPSVKQFFRDPYSPFLHDPAGVRASLEVTAKRRPTPIEEFAGVVKSSLDQIKIMKEFIENRLDSTVNPWSPEGRRFTVRRIDALVKLLVEWKERLSPKDKGGHFDKYKEPLCDLRSAIRQLQKQPEGAFLDAQSIRGLLNSVSRHFNKARPAGKCPKCQRGCVFCRQSGLVPESMAGDSGNEKKGKALRLVKEATA